MPVAGGRETKGGRTREANINVQKASQLSAETHLVIIGNGTICLSAITDEVRAGDRCRCWDARSRAGCCLREAAANCQPLGRAAAGREILMLSAPTSPLRLATVVRWPLKIPHQTRQIAGIASRSFTNQLCDKWCSFVCAAWIRHTEHEDSKSYRRLLATLVGRRSGHLTQHSSQSCARATAET